MLRAWLEGGGLKSEAGVNGGHNCLLELGLETVVLIRNHRGRESMIVEDSVKKYFGCIIRG